MKHVENRYAVGSNGRVPQSSDRPRGAGKVKSRLKDKAGTRVYLWRLKHQ